MKIKWREHERIMVTILVISQIVLALLRLLNPTTTPQGLSIEQAFQQNGFPFIYWKNVLLPQIATPLLYFLLYLGITLLVVPVIRKLSHIDLEKIFTLRVIRILFQLLLLSFLLAIGVNLASFFARPYLVNYANYQMLAWLGYNDHPLSNGLFGFDRALILVLLATAFFFLREMLIWLIEKPGRGREYRVYVTNNITLVILFALVLIFIWNPEHASLVLFVAMVIPALSYHFYASFWVFPFNGPRPFKKKFLLLRLILAAFLASLFSALLLRDELGFTKFMIYFLSILGLVTPLSWMEFKYRRGRIEELIGMEAALEKSKANLDFLRSQVNPHFLFNALNTLYGTAIREGAEKTAYGIQSLGDMMRFMLHDNLKDRIPMMKEIDYLNNYISFQKLRIESNPEIEIEENIEGIKCNREIAPMLLIPLVENAFKHGIRLREKSWIKIFLQCNEREINLEVRNSCHAELKMDTEKSASGIGLNNVKERLKLLYPGKHELVLGKTDKEFIANLRISYN